MEGWGPFRLQDDREGSIQRSLLQPGKALVHNRLRRDMQVANALQAHHVILSSDRSQTTRDGKNCQKRELESPWWLICNVIQDKYQCPLGGKEKGGGTESPSHRSRVSAYRQLTQGRSGAARHEVAFDRRGGMASKYGIYYPWHKHPGL